MFLLRWVFVDSGNCFEKPCPHLTVRVPAICYHYYMSHSNNAFCRPCLSSFMAPRMLKILWNTCWKAQILKLLVWLCQTQQQRYVVIASDIAKNSSPTSRYCRAHALECIHLQETIKHTPVCAKLWTVIILWELDNVTTFRNYLFYF